VTLKTEKLEMGDQMVNVAPLQTTFDHRRILRR